MITNTEINLKGENYIFTIDYSLRELRIVNIKNQEIKFIPLSNDDLDGLEYLKANDEDTFKECLQDYDY